ncbi:MAG: Bacterial export protein family 3 [Hyphomicrobiales bacterium]|nr:Bacterial export protein family 3 [Hyphomicrobiales bacterium]
MSDMNSFHDALTEALRTAAIMAVPILALAGFIGLIVGLLQSVFQIQDQTFSQIVKLFVIGGCLFLLWNSIMTPFVVFTDSVFRLFWRVG